MEKELGYIIINNPFVEDSPFDKSTEEKNYVKTLSSTNGILDLSNLKNNSKFYPNSENVETLSFYNLSGVKEIIFPSSIKEIEFMYSLVSIEDTDWDLTKYS